MATPAFMLSFLFAATVFAQDPFTDIETDIATATDIFTDITSISLPTITPASSATTISRPTTAPYPSTTPSSNSAQALALGGAVAFALVL